MSDAFVADVRYGLRHLRRSPGFTTVAVLTIALGVGANAALFSLLHGLVLRSLPIHDPNSLIGVAGRSATGDARGTPVSVVGELSRTGSPLEHVCGYTAGNIVAVEARGVPTHAVVATVTGQCFLAFGVQPILGRTITDDDANLDGPGHPVAVIGYRFWTQMFGSSPGVLGETVNAEGIELRIIGVMPQGFGGLQVDTGVDVFAPFDTIFPARPNRRPNASYLLGRLRSGLPLAQADARLTAVWPALMEAALSPTLPATERDRLRATRPFVQPVGRGVSFYRDRYAHPLTMLFALTAVLLALACLNLGALLLSRLSARTPELAVRYALGASHVQIARQLTIESVLLSFGGAGLGIPIAFMAVAVVASSVPSGLIEPSVRVAPDLTVLVFTSLVGVGAGILMSVLPVWVASATRWSQHLTGSRTIASATNRWARALLVLQVALSVVLVVGSAILTRSFHFLQRVDLGVQRSHVLIVRAMPLPNAYHDIDNASYYPPLLEKIAALPGVRSVGFARVFPRMTIAAPREPIAFVGDERGEIRAALEITSPGFFDTVGIPLVAGRVTAWSDDEHRPTVAVVSERLASLLAPDGDILGRRVTFGSNPRDRDVRIVGVVRSATLGNPREPDLPVFYRPALQMGRAANWPNIAIAVRGDADTVAAGVRRVLGEAGREYAQDVSLLDDVLARAPAGERVSAALSTLLAGLAIVLAFSGVYGLLAYNVSRRTREIGLRMAVGAARRAVIAMVVREGLTIALLGVVIGLPLAFVAARAAQSMLFGVSARDPLSFTGAAVFFLGLGLIAGIRPAQRAAHLDPVVALRAD